jgi:hypothetical protein
VLGGLHALADIFPCGEKRVTLVGPNTQPSQIPPIPKTTELKPNEHPHPD